MTNNAAFDCQVSVIGYNIFMQKNIDLHKQLFSNLSDADNEQIDRALAIVSRIPEARSVWYMLFVPDIFALERTNGIE